MIEQIESPCSSVGPLFSQGLQAYERAVTRLLKDIPQLGAILKERFDTSGWQAMEARFRAYLGCRDRGMNPPLVVTMFGPSGAGKSTVFRYLTGLQVPAGEEIRPTTRHCVVAVPSALCQQEVLESIFPHQELIRLRSPEEIRQPSRSDSWLFYAPMSSEPSGNGELPPLILADVPDFNTVESENWKRAEQMLSRAELTIFLVYPESYSDNRTVEMLAKCCRLSQLLVYVFTKTGREAAQAKWQHLLEIVRDRKDFQEVRSDGHTLAGFLARSVCYYSPRVTEDAGEDALTIEPLEEGSPPFVEFIRGQLAERLVVGALAQSACVAVPTCREVLLNGCERFNQLKKYLCDAEDEFHGIVNTLIKSIYPAPREILGEVKKVAKEKMKKGILKWVIKAFTMLTKLPKSVVDALRKLITSGHDEGAPQAVDLEELEKGKLSPLLDEFLSRWRNNSSTNLIAPHGMFSAERCEIARNRVLNDRWPKPSSDWRRQIQSEIHAWVESHPRWAAFLALMNDLSVVAGTSLFVVDLGLSGGVVGSIGSLSAAAVMSPVAAWLIQWFVALHLQEVADCAYQAWTQQRSAEITDYLKKGFYNYLFDPWLKEYERLSSIDFAEALKACDELEGLARRSRIA